MSDTEAGMTGSIAARKNVLWSLCRGTFLYCTNVITRAMLTTFVCIAATAYVTVPRTSHALIDVWIDPGHGGSARGTLGFNGSAYPDEKDINLQVSQFLQNILLGEAYSSFLTRNGDTDLSLAQRAKIANGEAPNDEDILDSCQLFISIHMNGDSSSSKYGTETYYSESKKYVKSKKRGYLPDKNAADQIHPCLMSYANLAFLFPRCSTDRHVKSNSFYVLKYSKSPAILVEACFLTNGCQFSAIQNSNNQALIAEGIAIGVTYVIGPSGYTPNSDLEASLLPGVGCPDLITRGDSSLVCERNVVGHPDFSDRGAPVEPAALEEGFENSTFPPPGWSLQTTGAPIPHTWHRTTDTLYVESGLGAALIEGEYSGIIDEWLVTPSVTLSTHDRAIRFLWAGSRYWASAVNAFCYVRIAGSSEWAELWALSSEPDADPFIYRDRTIDLSPWVGESVQFAFRVQGRNGADFAMDDVVVGDFEPTGVPANDLCGNAIALSGPFDINGVTCYAHNLVSPCIPPNPSCPEGDLGGPEVWYRFDVAAGDTLIASVSGEWNPALYLVDGCDAANCLAWAYSMDGWSPSSISHIFATGGTYYMAVDGAEGSCGPFNFVGEVTGAKTGVRDWCAPSTYLLYQPYPNPFNPVCTIRYDIAHAGRARLRVFDLNGSLVRTLVDSWREPGAYSEVWDGKADDGSALPSGVYFYRLEAGDFVATRKMVLLK